MLLLCTVQSQPAEQERPDWSGEPSFPSTAPQDLRNRPTPALALPCIPLQTSALRGLGRHIWCELGRMPVGASRCAKLAEMWSAGDHLSVEGSIAHAPHSTIGPDWCGCMHMLNSQVPVTSLCVVSFRGEQRETKEREREGKACVWAPPKRGHE